MQAWRAAMLLAMIAATLLLGNIFISILTSESRFQTTRASTLRTEKSTEVSNLIAHLEKVNDQLTVKLNANEALIEKLTVQVESLNAKEAAIENLKVLIESLPIKKYAKRLSPLSRSAQVEPLQALKILQALDEKAGSNLLVFGLGNDSPFWNQATAGRVVFIEDDFEEQKEGVQWFDQITGEFPELEAYRVHYNPKLYPVKFEHYTGVKWDDRSLAADLFLRQLWQQPNPEWYGDLSLLSKLPDTLNLQWDVILVDAPLGCCEMGPGRYESLYTSWEFAKANFLRNGARTHIFVDDYNRRVEREFSRILNKGEPIELTGRIGKTGTEPNIQAHFVCCDAHAIDVMARG